MKKIIFLVLFILPNFTNANEVIRLNEIEKLRLNLAFDNSISPLLRLSGDGDVVGNGGGLLEQNFLLAYYSLQTAIENCLTLIECYTSENQKNILKEINQLFIDKINDRRPLLFLRNSDTDNFFFDRNDQTERVAKTGFSKDYPIFINLDLSMDIINDIPTMLGILIHELGHQLGIVNHSFLDQMGVKLRKIWASNWIVSRVDIAGEELIIRLFSTKSNFINSKLSYVFDGEVQSLNSLVSKSVSCNKGDVLHNFSLSNGHWRRPDQTSFKLAVIKTFWVDIYCEDQNSQSYLVKKDLDVHFSFNTFRKKDPVLKSVEVLLR